MLESSNHYPVHITEYSAKGSKSLEQVYGCMHWMGGEREKKEKVRTYYGAQIALKQNSSGVFDQGWVRKVGRYLTKYCRSVRIGEVGPVTSDKLDF